jgi:hypothetical protein
MKSAVAMSLEGVMMKPVAQTPIPEGLLLYNGLCNVSALIIISGETEQGIVEDWLMTENLTAHANVVYPDKLQRRHTVPDTRLLQVNRLRHLGYAVDLVIVPEPDVAALLISEGYNSMVFLHAAYAVPSWRPDFRGPVQPWSELEKAVTDQARMRALDTRIEKEQRDTG